jgi:hypothetical protein
MPQLYPTAYGASSGLTINTAYPLTGGGTVASGGTLNLGISSSQSSQRNVYSVTPAANGTIQNFTVVGLSSSADIGYADVYVNGVLTLSANYSFVGNLVSFNTAPAASAEIFAVFSSPSDTRQQFTLTPTPNGTTTTFSFPSVSPQGSYVDIYNNGVLQNTGSGAANYYLDIVNGVYSVVFNTAPASGVTLTSVFDPTVNAGRTPYALSPLPNGSTTVFTVGGNPTSAYVDAYVGGLFKAEGTDYTLSYLSGIWTLTFGTAPASGSAPVAVFAPSVYVPAAALATSGPANEFLAAPNGSSGSVTLRPISPSDLPAATTSTEGIVQLAGDLSGTASSPTVVSTHLASPLPIAQGGTAASTSATALSNLGGAPLASPALTGTPTVPTATAGTNTTQIASTAFVTTAVATETTRAEAAEALKAPLASPALTGIPTVPTATAGTNTTQAASTAFVTSAVGVETTRATAAEALKAPIASPTFTGTATSPTFTDGYNTYSAAQINRSGGDVELQYVGGSGNNVRMFGNTAYPIVFNATNGSISNSSTQTLVNGSITGAAGFQQPEQGSTYKVVVIYLSGLLGTASYTFPTAFAGTPAIVSTNQIAASVVTSLSTTAITITGAPSTGFLMLIGY